MKRQGQGGVSDHLVSHCREGDLLTLAEPAGDFVLPDAVPERLLMVTAGSGITPVHSIVKSLLASNFDGKVTWVHFERRYRDLMLSDSLAVLRRDPRLDLRLVLSGDSPVTATRPAVWMNTGSPTISTTPPGKPFSPAGRPAFSTR